MLLKITLIIITVLLVGCGSAAGGVKPIENSDIKRFVDYEAQVVCYTVVRSSSISINCMPLSQTALPKE